MDQFVFATPADSPEGCYVPVQVRVGGSAVSNTVTMAIQSEGNLCSEPDNPFTQTFLDGGTIGAVTLTRALLESTVDVIAPSTFTVDQAAGYFQSESGGPFPFNPFFALPPAGACTAYSRPGDLLAGDAIPFVPSAGLDAGELSLNGPNGSAQLPPAVSDGSTDYNPTVVGGPEGLSEAEDAPLYLSPGNVAVTGAGGADVGAIAAAADVTDPPEWTNSGDLSEVARDSSLSFTWAGAARARVVVAGISVDKPANASAMFLCIAPEGSTSLDVPAAVLANLPAARSIIGQSDGLLILGSWPTGAPEGFAAEGLNQAGVLFQSVHSKRVRFR